MSGRSLVAALIVLAAPLAGCIGSDPGTNTSDAPVEQASTPGVENGTIDTETLEGAIVFSAATPVISFNANPPMAEGPFLFELERPEGATGHVLEVTWEAATPASESLDIWVRDASEGNIPPSDPTDPVPAGPVATETGESPLKLAISEDDLEDDTDYSVIVRAPSDMGAGVTVDQPFTLHKTTFENIEFDPGYSALDDGSAAD